MRTVTLLILRILVAVIFLMLTASYTANALFDQKVEKEVSKLFITDIESKKETVSKADLEGLPLCVQKWLESSQVVGKERIRTVRLKQEGLLRTKEGQPWMPTEAEQYFAINKPGFVWKARIKAAPLIYIMGRDKYYEGKGDMLIKLLSLITLVDAKGEELDQGALLRYLAEMIWFPSAALSDYIKWEEIDSNSAKATMSYGGIKASGVFLFNEKYEVVNFVAQRYMETNGQYSLETWSPIVKEYKDFNGIKVPSKAEVMWKLKTGDFKWYQFETTDIEYNKPHLFEN
ncbi:MAG TPA: hypothetical protein PLL98_03155 [Bacillota bacterium]|nr:hypothetical protein [Bacillota bacterium]